MAKTRPDLPEAVIDQLITYLAEGDTITRATRRLKINRRLLYNIEDADPKRKRQIREALAAGARFQIDQALEQQKKATTKDQAIIADKLMQAAARRAELVAPHAYGKQAQPLLTAPDNSKGSLTISWETAPDDQQDGSGQVDDATKAGRLTHTNGKAIEARPLDVVFEDVTGG